MERYVALLRGVNVGGKNKIAMQALSGFFEDAKCKNVSTYIQSGNVVFSADAKTAAKSSGGVCQCIQEQLGFQTTVILRSLAEMERVVKSNPYTSEQFAVDRIYAMFLAASPTAELAATLDPDRSPPDEFTVSGSEIFLYLPSGAGTTKLTNAYFDSRLKTVSTARNWRTVQKLLEMMRAA